MTYSLNIAHMEESSASQQFLALLQKKIMVRGEDAYEALWNLGTCVPSNHQFQRFSLKELNILRPMTIDQLLIEIREHNLLPCTATHVVNLALKATEDIALAPINSRSSIILSEPVVIRDERLLFRIGRDTNGVYIGLVRYEILFDIYHWLIGIYKSS